MPHGAVVAFAALEFESDYFFAFVLFDNFSGNSWSGKSWSANLNVGSICEQEDVEFGVGACFDVEFFDVDHITFGDPVLLAASLNDCVCHKNFPVVENR